MPNYDVAVLGAGLGGMAAAALLAKRRKRVILVEPASETGGMHAPVERSAFRFAAGPVLVYGCEQGGSLRALSAKLGIAQHVSRASPVYQVVLPDRRIAIYADQNETLDELRREFPREIDGLSRLHREIRRLAAFCAKSPLLRTVVRRLSAAAYLQRFRFSRELAVFFSIRSLAFFGLPLERLSIASLLQLIDSPPFRLDGGTAGLVEQLRDTFVTNGGELMTGEPWPEMFRAGKRIREVKTAKGLIQSPAVLVNAATYGSEIVSFMTVYEGVIPSEMAQHVLCLFDYNSSDSLCTLTLSSKDDTRSAPQGMRTITAVFSSYGKGQPRDDTGMERLQKVVPFLADHIAFAESRKFAERAYPLPQGVEPRSDFRRIEHPALLRTTARNLYLLPDGIGAPQRAAAAAMRFDDLIR